MGTKANGHTVPVAGDLTAGDLFAAVGQGWRDFIARPQHRLFFASFYVVAGAAFYFLLMVRGETRWLIASVAGFPLLAPFAAVGL